MRNTHNISSNEYNSIHYWLRKNHKKPAKCSNKLCLGRSTRIEWALKKGKEYSRNIEDYIALCKSCHSAYDVTENTRKKISTAKLGKKFTKEQLVNRLIPIVQYSKSGQKIKVFPSINEAAAALKVNKTNIVNCARGVMKSAKGYVWKYESKFRKTSPSNTLSSH